MSWENKCEGSTEGTVPVLKLSIQLSNSDFSWVSSSGCPTGAGGDGTLNVAENPSGRQRQQERHDQRLIIIKGCGRTTHRNQCRVDGEKKSWRRNTCF